jgi:AcrR family transcriptional regulator
VSVGSLYQYFPNKESLLYALGEHHANEMAQLAQHHLEGLGDRSILEVLQQIIKAALAAYTVNPKLYRILHQQVPRSEEMRKLDDARIEQMFYSFLVPHRDQLRPKNLDITVFIVSRTIKALLYDAIADRPNLLKNGELEQEIMRMLSSYLISPNSL